MSVSRKQLSACGASLIAAVAIAAALQSITVARSPAVAPDGIGFIVEAKVLQVMPVETMTWADQHPGYPVMILGCQWLLARTDCRDSVKCWIAAARLATGIFGILCIPVLWSLTRIVFGSRAAAVAALLAAVLPLFRQNASDALSDAPHLFFYLLAVYFCARGLPEGHAGWFAAAGASSGLAFWIRPEGLSVAIVGALYLALNPWIRTIMPGLSHGIAPAASASYRCATRLVLMVLIVISPYVVVTGKLTSKKDSLKLLFTQAEEGRRLPAVFVNVPYALGNHVVRGLKYFLVIPLVFGLAARRRSDREKALIWLAALLIAFHLMLMAGVYILSGYASDRHMTPAIALVLPWVAAGLLDLKDRMDGSQAGRAIAGRRVTALSAAILVFILLGLALRSARPINQNKMPLLRVASEIRQHVPAQDGLISNSPHVLFYADMWGRALTDFEAFPKVTSSRFVVLDSTSNFNPEWPSQLISRYKPSDLGIRYSPPDGILIFERR
ncbi:MAG TPA: glycosyltransferase family 39 protein [Acidobacteriota bacterium]